MKKQRATERGRGWTGQEVMDEEIEQMRGHTTDGVIGSWEISRSLFLEGVSAGAAVSIMMV